MFRFTLLAFTLLTTTHAHAVANFFCYSVPGTAPQVYEYATLRCGPGTMNASKLGTKDGERDVLCVHQAACQPTNETTADAPQRDAETLGRMLLKGELKLSVTLCSGKGMYAEGILVGSRCPKANECRRDVFYNFGMGPVSHEPPVGSNAGGSSLQSKGAQ